MAVRGLPLLQHPLVDLVRPGAHLRDAELVGGSSASGSAQTGSEHWLRGKRRERVGQPGLVAWPDGDTRSADDVLHASAGRDDGG